MNIMVLSGWKFRLQKQTFLGTVTGVPRHVDKQYVKNRVEAL